MYGKKQEGNMFVHELQLKASATVHINNTHNPPIDVEGEVTCFTVACMHFSCDNKVPIPSKGVVKFSTGNGRDILALNVDIISRIECPKNFWTWKSPPKYEVRLSLNNNPKEAEERYQAFIHRMLFGQRTAPSQRTEEAESYIA